MEAMALRRAGAGCWLPGAVVSPRPLALGSQHPAPSTEETATLIGILPEVENILRPKPSQPTTDESLVRAVGAGSQEALEELYERHMRNCYGLAMKIVRDPSVA